MEDKDDSLTALSLNRRIGTVIPCFRSRDWIAQCLDSVENQRLRPYKVCCVFDGPDPEAEAIAKRHPVVTDIVVRELASGGASAPRNCGWERVRRHVEFLHFLDCDDLVSPEFYSSLVKVLSDYPDISLVSSGHIDIRPGSSVAMAIAACDGRIGSPSICCWSIDSLPTFTPPSFMLFRASALDGLREGGSPWLGAGCAAEDGRQEAMEDIELVIRLLERHRIASVAARLGVYRLLSDSVSSSAKRTFEMVFKAYEQSLRPWVRSAEVDRAYARQVERLAASAARQYARTRPRVLSAAVCMAGEMLTARSVRDRVAAVVLAMMFLLGVDKRRREFLESDSLRTHT